MKMRIAVFALAALAGAALAQGPPPERGGRGRMGFEGAGGPGGPALDYGPGILRAGVKNAPFSADAITETTHTLADGNRIRQTLTLKIYRDSEGRTRRDQAVNLNGLTPDANPQQMVFINDPVAGVSYSLNARQRTGVKMSRQDAPGRGPGPGPGQRLPGAEARLERRRGVVPKSESLGRQTIEGVQADGHRTTLTIPAGQAGNELPIVIVTENWYSPELRATVLSKHSDPRVGESVTRLTNISRAEPAHSLFEVAADYRLRESDMGRQR